MWRHPTWRCHSLSTSSASAGRGRTWRGRAGGDSRAEMWHTTQVASVLPLASLLPPELEPMALLPSAGTCGAPWSDSAGEQDCSRKEPTRFMLGLGGSVSWSQGLSCPVCAACSGTKGPRREDDESELQTIAGGHLGAVRNRAVGVLLELGTMWSRGEQGWNHRTTVSRRQRGGSTAGMGLNLGKVQPKRVSGGEGSLASLSGRHGEELGCYRTFLYPQPHSSFALLNKSWGQTQELGGCLSFAAAGGPFPASAQTGGGLVVPALVALVPSLVWPCSDSLCFVEVWSHLAVPQLPLGPGGADAGGKLPRGFPTWELLPIQLAQWHRLL